jgi:UDP-N-acetylglucosamine 1-carboxyvinyltransferase
VDRFIIDGGRPLVGTIPIGGAKNAALAIMAGTLLADEPCIIRNVPRLLDVQVMSDVLASLGVAVNFPPTGDMLTIDASTLREHTCPYDLVTKMRASFFVLGPILARLGQARIPLPGGCAIGSRPVDLHLKGLRSLGAKVTIEHGYAEATADRLVGAPVYLDYPSVGATETIMMAACLAEGTTIIDNCAQEPEIVDLAQFLKKCGAKIEGAGTEQIVVHGRKRLHGCDHATIPDRIEAGTFLIAAAITKGDLRLTGVRPEFVASLISKLQEIGVNIVVEDLDVVRVSVDGPLTPADVRTMPFPGFPTDLQAQIMALLSVIPGTSVISETVFENRFLHVDELLRMGANIKTDGNVAVIQGVEELTGAPVRATDLRAGAALIMAGLAARGQTVVSDIHYIDRGYEHVERKLSNVGGKISRSGVAEPILA